mmetsp:Transcript_24860/g.72838  ORF Transcript_24860/g.72838 Transcript_24860/m.72838 type:complete len:85 (+) Transcript_24860:1288-1542(+)
MQPRIGDFGQGLLVWNIDKSAQQCVAGDVSVFKNGKPTLTFNLNNCLIPGISVRGEFTVIFPTKQFLKRIEQKFKLRNREAVAN